jgi:hypothetical protein
MARTDPLSPGMPKDTTWDGYVASWPAWRLADGCEGQCVRASTCGRARVCLQTWAHMRRLVYALARLSALTGERPPAPRRPE